MYTGAVFRNEGISDIEDIRFKARRRNRRSQMIHRAVVALAMIAILPVIFSFAKLALEPESRIAAQTYNNDLKNFDRIQIVVQPGDTAWAIQSKFTPNEDTRNMLQLDEYINHKSIGNLYVGEPVTFLKPKS